MLRLILILSAFVSTSQANPISAYLVDPPHTMVAENVLIGVTEKGAVVSGRYRFRVTPNARGNWPTPYKLVISLPIPVPASLKTPDEVRSVAQPALTIKRARYLPSNELSYSAFPSLPQEVKLAVFYFFVDRADLEEEFELEIQYDQPVIAVNGKDLVYYIPFLPNFEAYKKRMNLKEESFLITFEGVSPATLDLVSSVGRIERSDSRMISVRPNHLEIIAVERKISPKSSN